MKDVKSLLSTDHEPDQMKRVGIVEINALINLKFTMIPENIARIWLIH
jgi:hypothetical protein